MSEPNSPGEKRRAQRLGVNYQMTLIFQNVRPFIMRPVRSTISRPTGKRLFADGGLSVP